ncbi:hypothetical protein LA080_006020 [Diaporthe eres]|nr:hypothetical protein LA080_006020 [Diaporthe eres]
MPGTIFQIPKVICEENYRSAKWEKQLSVQFPGHSSIGWNSNFAEGVMGNTRWCRAAHYPKGFDVPVHRAVGHKYVSPFKTVEQDTRTGNIISATIEVQFLRFSFANDGNYLSMVRQE